MFIAHMRSSVLYLLLCTCFLSSILSCADQTFDPKSLLLNYRVLAVKADPPAIGLTEQTTLTLIEFHPNELTEDEVPTIKYEWSLCLFTFGSLTQYECAVDEIPLEESGNVVRLAPLELFATLGDDFLKQLEMADSMLSPEMSAFDTGSLNVYVKFTATPEGEEPFKGVKQVTINFDDQLPNNKNPQIDAITLVINDPAKEGQFFANSKIKLEASATEDSSELYIPTQDPFDISALSTFGEMDQEEESMPEESDQEPVNEELLFSWFVTAGELKSEYGYIDGDDSLLDTTLTLPKEEGKMRVYLSLRDGRGGLDIKYIEFEVTIPPEE